MNRRDGHHNRLAACDGAVRTKLNWDCEKFVISSVVLDTNAAFIDDL